MATDFLERSDAVEECYEYLLAYAGQGLPGDLGEHSHSQVRQFLTRAANAMEGLVESFNHAVSTEALRPTSTYEEFGRVLERDAQSSLAAIRIVLAQPNISSQLVDNLNASIHIRALLTDLFLIGEVLSARAAVENTQT
jgi:hypothetical protein